LSKAIQSSREKSGKSTKIFKTFCSQVTCSLPGRSKEIYPNIFIKKSCVSGHDPFAKTAHGKPPVMYGK
jgi:hypothetical protein